MSIIFLFQIACLIVVEATDPCPQMCEAIPGACSADGSRCVAELCTDLFWKTRSTLCNSSIPDCPRGNPVMCGHADEILEAHVEITASDGVQPDPCSQLCDAVPGACADVETACIDDLFCANLYWLKDGAVLCNASQRACISSLKRFVTCLQASVIVSAQNEDGVVAYDPSVGFREEAGNEDSEPVIAFGQGTGARGRRGFTNVDGTTSNLASLLQVLLHSHAIRDAMLFQIGFSVSRKRAALQDPVFSSFVSLLNQMCSEEQEALDLTEFRSAIGEAHSDDPLHLLRYVLERIARVSRSVSSAVTMEMTPRLYCHKCSYLNREEVAIGQAVQVVSFPESTPSRTRWTVKELLATHIAASFSIDRGVCPRCSEVGGITEFISDTSIPNLLSIGIDRHREGSAERVNHYVDTPLEMDLAGIVSFGEVHKFRLVGLVREIHGKYVADYFDSDRGEWIHANDKHLHVIQGQPRNGGTDVVIVVYESCRLH